MAYYASVWDKNGDTSQRLLLLGSTISSVASLPSGYNGTLVTNFDNADCDVSGNKAWYSSYRATITEVIINNIIFPNYCDRLFHGCTTLRTIHNIKNLRTDNTDDLTRMFYGCGALTTLDLSHFKTANVVSTNNMFQNCTSLTVLDFSNLNLHSLATATNMFRACGELTTIYVANENHLISEDATGLNMFNGCNKLVGGNGTTISSLGYIDILGLHIDVPGTPGYLTQTSPRIYLNNTQVDNIYFNSALINDVYLN